MREVPNKGRFGNAVQVADVVCSWQKASRKAFLTYGHAESLEAAKKILDGYIISSGSTLRATILDPTQSEAKCRVHTLEVQNLDLETESTLFGDMLTAAEKPSKIKLMEPRYKYNDSEVASMLQDLLASIGPLLRFQITSEPRSSRVFANVSYPHPHHAVAATKALNE